MTRPERRHGGGTALAGALLLGAIVGAAVIGPAAVPADPYATTLEARLQPPGPGHWLGRDGLGRDVLARVLYGARISLAVGGTTVAISLLAGLIVGGLAGYRGGWVDEAIGRVIDVLLAFPGLLLAIALAAVLGPGIDHLILALSLLGWTGYARLVRSEIAALRRREFVRAAEALGAPPLGIVVRHLLPLVTPLLLLQATVGLAGAIVAEAGLSFLGLGAPAPMPSWGAMIDEGRAFLLVAPHVILAPGLALTATVTGLQLLGDGLRDLLDVRQR